MADMAATSDQVKAALQNADGSPDIYITQDPALNVLTITVSNRLENEIVFPPGSPVPYGQLGPEQSAIYVFFDGLIDNADIAAMRLSREGWAGASVTSPDTVGYLVIAPTSRVTLPPDGALTFSLGNVTVHGAPRSRTVDFALAGAQGVPVAQTDVPLYINIAAPPQPDKRTLDVSIGFDVPAVYTGQPQTLTLFLSNLGTTPLVPGGTKSWHGVTPTFQLTLVYGDEPGALTTIADAAAIGMDIRDSYGNVWRPPQRREQGKQPHWVLQPDPDGGGTVLGTGEQHTIEFSVSGIEATLPAGLASARTIAYVSWHDVPGYNDGSIGVDITKRSGPLVTAFTADPPSVPYGQSRVRTVLSWETAHASLVRFDAPGVDPAQTFWTSGSGPVAGGIDVPRGATVTLTAYKDISPGVPAVSGAPQLPGDDMISTKARLRISGASYNSVDVGLGSLGHIVLAAEGPRAFLFQMNAGEVRSTGLTQTAVLDLSSPKLAGLLDLARLVAPKGGTVQTEAVAPSPDGTTIHVLAAQLKDLSNPTTTYSVLPLNVAEATYGAPTALGILAPYIVPAWVSLFAAPDGRTVYLAGPEGPGHDGVHVYALDAASYALEQSWYWRPTAIWPPAPVAAGLDGNVLVMSGMNGLTSIDVSRGFTEISTFNFGQQLGLVGVHSPVVSPDGRRVYFFAIDGLQAPVHGYLLAIDVDLDSGGFRLAHNAPLGVVEDVAGPAALSVDGGTLYVLTNADTVTAFDTATFAAVPYQCGTDGGYTPLRIAAGPQPYALYGTGSKKYSNGILSILAFG